MSSVASVPVTGYPWPADVLEFAATQKVAPYLEPLLEATRTLFPTAEVKVFFERDVSLPEEYIVFEVHVPLPDASDYLAANHKWLQEIHRICPAPLHIAFAFSLMG
jgi:hypothetical protein